MDETPYKIDESKRIKVLFIGLKGSSFCINDEAILRKEFDVLSIYLSTAYLKELPILLFRIFKEMRKRDLAYVWFGDLWAALSVFVCKFLGKGSIIVAGGYDAANEPSLDYGLLNRRFIKYAPIYAFRNCNMVLAVSEFTRSEVMRIRPDPGGVVTVANAIDTDRFRIIEGMDRKSIITVGNVTKRTIFVKGFDNFLEVVRRSPVSEFVHVGRIDPDIKFDKPANLEIVGFKKGEDLVQILNRSKCYLQLSKRESFGVAVIESMACGCIPVVTNIGGLTEAVGDAGITVEPGDWDDVVKAIEQEYDPSKGALARQRVLKLFDSSVREDKVLRSVREVVNGSD